MQIKIFTIPAFGGEKIMEELNVFLRSKKILQVEKAYNETSAAWSFCISYIDDVKIKGKERIKIDYKEALDKESFERFSKMREIRKRIAKEEGLPAYAIFTDVEMAELANKFRKEQLKINF